jgi:radical SAM superfamily enzyme YgiQ (UPF0313 family)
MARTYYAWTARGNLMKEGHGIILGGILEREDGSESRGQKVNTYGDEKTAWIGVKRSAGGHRIATYLREQGWDIEVLDFWPAWTREELLQFFKSRVREDTYWVGISAMFPLGGSGAKDQAKVKEMVAIIIELKELYPQLAFIGGAQNISAVLAYPLDYYVGGFGEYAIVEVLKHVKGEPCDLKVHKRIYWGAERNVIECRHDYPAFPMPDAAVKYEDRDYIQPDEVLTIELARGCKFKCKFCSFTVLGVKDDYSRCAQSLDAELRENYERWGTTMYSVSDETINDRPEKLKKIAEVVKNLPFELNLMGFMRADLLVANPDTWQDIWDMGLWSHFYGVETLNHEAGKFVGKGMNPDRLKAGMLKAKEWFEEQGKYRVSISTIIGIPGETRETMMATKEWVKEHYQGQAFSFAPLMIMDGEMMHMMTNPSEFDRTWRESGKFHELSQDYLDNLDWNELNPMNHEYARFLLQSNGIAKWGHDTMNLWEAIKIATEINQDVELTKQLSPGIFYYHRYITTGKYKLEDMMKTFNEIEPFNVNDVLEQGKWINEYKNKKLNAGYFGEDYI